MSALTVGDVMTTEVVTVAPGTPFKDVVAVLHEHRISAVPVVVAGVRPVGVVSEADLLTSVGARRNHRTGMASMVLATALAGAAHRRRVRGIGPRIASEAMSRALDCIGPDEPLSKAARALEHRRRLFVVDSTGRLVGVVSRRDVLRVFLKTDDELAEEIRRDVLCLLPEPALAVEVSDGEVTLSGFAEPLLVERVADLVGQIPGVVAVHTSVTESPVTPTGK